MPQTTKHAASARTRRQLVSFYRDEVWGLRMVVDHVSDVGDMAEDVLPHQRSRYNSTVTKLRNPMRMQAWYKSTQGEARG